MRLSTNQSEESLKNSYCPIIIVGSGWAGYTLAREFRKLDKTTPLMILTADDGRYYYKPQLSNALTQQQTIAMLTMDDAIGMANKLNAAIHTHVKVTRIDPTAKKLYTENQSFSYDKLVLACGGKPKKLTISGDLMATTINNISNYMAIRDFLETKKHIAIIGSGFVGSEFANDLINVGHHVDVIAPCKYPFENFAPPEIGMLLQAELGKKGIQWHLQKSPVAIKKSADSYKIELSDQSTLKADLVLSAVGLQPNVELAESSGLQFNCGIQVDSYLETSSTDIYALGDCVEVNGLVLQFIAPILQCARSLAKTLAGHKTAVHYPAMPIILKTPACPMVFLPPPKSCVGEWQILGEGNHLTALFYDAEHHLRGFALTGEAVKEQVRLAQEVDNSKPQ